MGTGIFKKLQAKLKNKVFKPGIPQAPENSESFKKWLKENPPRAMVIGPRP
jgi:hypothetical protein